MTGDDRQLSINYLVIVTRRKKRYKFDMSQKRGTRVYPPSAGH